MKNSGHSCDSLPVLATLSAFHSHYRSRVLMRQVFYPASFYLHDQRLSRRFEAISMSLYTDLPWPCHIQLKLSYVGSVSQWLDADLICHHVHISHSGIRLDLRLFDG